MEVIHANDKVSIICAYKTFLTMWYLTLQKDDFGEYDVMVDAVKTISSRMRKFIYYFYWFILYSYHVIAGGRITALHAVFVNPLRTNRPSVYLGNTGGVVQAIVPTGKYGSLYDHVYIYFIITNPFNEWLLTNFLF